MVIGLTNVAIHPQCSAQHHQLQSGAVGIYPQLYMDGTLVFVIEGAIYGKLLYRYEARPERKIQPWLYAFMANVLSFAVGMLVAKWIPGIFCCIDYFGTG